MITSGLSVLMCVYAKDSSLYLDMALYSVTYGQTREPEQIVLVCDGPLGDELNEVLNVWKEKISYLDIVRLEENIGLAKALNIGLNLCEFDLVARMDADDISMPSRFEEQLTFMHSHPDVDVCSSWIEEVSADNIDDLISIRKLPESDEELRNFAKRRSPMSHPAVIYKLSSVRFVGGYPENFRKLQDYALWSLMLVNGMKLANVQKVLLKMRAGDDLMRRRGFHHLLYEIKLFRFQKRIGFLSSGECLSNIFLRIFLRLSPVFLRRIFYRHMR